MFYSCRELCACVSAAANEPEIADAPTFCISSSIVWCADVHLLQSAVCLIAFSCSSSYITQSDPQHIIA